MEEDIKLLEEMKQNCLTKREYIDPKAERKAQALENLIKGYRELEKQLDSSRKANELLNKTNNELRLEIRTTYSKVVNDIISKFNLGDEYIPKTKIKEKIEELEEEIDKLADEASKSILENNQGKFDLVNKSANNISMQIQALRELMEDK